MFSILAAQPISKGLPMLVGISASLFAPLIVSLIGLFRHRACGVIVLPIHNPKVNRRDTMRGKRLLGGLLVLAALLGMVMFVAQSVAAKDTDGPNTISAELIGQVYNPSPAVGAQYGYISYLKGIDTAAITGPGGALSERTALVTFYSHTNTERVINNGSMRVLDRKGEITFYLDTTPEGDFSRPETLRQGVAVMAAALRHQVIVDTLTGAFTAHFDCTVARSDRFNLGNARYQLGKPGDRFEITVQGHLNAQPPPSGYMTGFVTGLELRPAD